MDAQVDERYARQCMLHEIGHEGQAKLRQAKVLIVGTGGLGSPISLYLAGAGVGTIGVIDDDVVSVSNLHRQVLYEECQVGQSKVALAAQRLHNLNSDIEVQVHACRFTADNADEIVPHYDIVVDACDNFATRYLINDTCIKWNKPYVYGAIQGFDGQVSVFCTSNASATYRTLHPNEEETLHMPPPFKGVVGPTPAVVGAVQAHEVMKLICGYGEPLINKLWTIDLLSMQSFTIDLM